MAEETEPAGTAGTTDQRENWFLLMDPAWQPEAENDTPPLSAVVGVWPLDSAGTVGKFHPNPDYEPSDENSPADPLDAVLHLAMRGEAEAELLQLMLRETVFDVAMNDEGRPVAATSPDDVPCVVVATAEVHRRRVNSPDWQRADLMELVELLDDDVDVLFNPGGAASVRLTGDFLRLTVLLDDDQVEALYSARPELRDLRISSYDTGPARS
ncbi:type VII secretion system-associated protein [Amycolatopsis sp. lyj-109]|uniref:type VII secretion system-associated protein n=1 Tax=Amycolatopsis sp. lyj-109 TaxID=2789287 RepID=UPI00397959FA